MQYYGSLQGVNMVKEFLLTGRGLFLMLCDMATEVFAIFTKPMKDLFEADKWDTWFVHLMDSILDNAPIGNESLMSLMFGSGIVIILLIILKNFIL